MQNYLKNKDIRISIKSIGFSSERSNNLVTVHYQVQSKYPIVVDSQGNKRTVVYQEGAQTFDVVQTDNEVLADMVDAVKAVCEYTIATSHDIDSEAIGRVVVGKNTFLEFIKVFDVDTETEEGLVREQAKLAFDTDLEFADDQVLEVVESTDENEEQPTEESTTNG